MSGRHIIHRLASMFMFGIAAAPAWSQEPPLAPEPVETVNEFEEVQVVAEMQPNAPLPKELKVLVEARAIETMATLRPLLRAELHLIRNVCNTSKDEQCALAKEGDRILKIAALWATECQIKMEQGVADNPMPDVLRMIQNGLAAAVASRLSRPQTEAYQNEVGRRILFLRDAVARGVVSRFDGLLGLDADQRGKIAAALLTSTAPIGRELDAVLNDPEEYPNVPESAFAPQLDPRARRLWRETQNGEHMIYESDIIGVNSDEADFAEEDDPVDAAKEKVRRFMSMIIQQASALVQPGGDLEIRGVAIAH